MPKRAAANDAPAQLGKRRSKPPQRYHELAAAEKPEDDASDSDEPEGLARFTPAALDQPSKAVRQSLQKKENGRERRTVSSPVHRLCIACASPVHRLSAHPRPASNGAPVSLLVTRLTGPRRNLLGTHPARLL